MKFDRDILLQETAMLDYNSPEIQDLASGRAPSGYVSDLSFQSREEWSNL